MYSIAQLIERSILNFSWLQVIFYLVVCHNLFLLIGTWLRSVPLRKGNGQESGIQWEGCNWGPGSKHKKAYLFLDLVFFMDNDYTSWNRCPTCWVQTNSRSSVGFSPTSSHMQWMHSTWYVTMSIVICTIIAEKCNLQIILWIIWSMKTQSNVFSDIFFIM